MRTIDADALIDEIKKDTEKAIDDGDKVGSFWLGYIAGLVIKQPSIQPEPKEGHWIRRDCGLDVECKCSKCGYRDFVEPRDEYWFKRNYCPNCGAKMTISTK